MKTFSLRAKSAFLIITVLIVSSNVPVIGETDSGTNRSESIPVGKAWEMSRSNEHRDGLKSSLDLLARMHMVREEWDQAVRVWTKLLTEFPDFRDKDFVLLQMAVCYEELKRPEEAIDLLTELLHQAPEGPVSQEARLKLAHMLSSQVTSPDDLENIFFNVFSDFSPFSFLPSVIARINASCNQDFMDCDRALRVLDDLVRLFPKTESGAQALLQAGIILEYNLSDPDRALRRFERILQWYESGVWAGRARVLLALHYLFFQGRGMPRTQRKGLVASKPERAFASELETPGNKEISRAQKLLVMVAENEEFRRQDKVWYAFGLCVLGHVQQFFLHLPEKSIQSYERLAELVPYSKWSGLALFQAAVAREFQTDGLKGALEEWLELKHRAEKLQTSFNRRETGAWLSSSANLGVKRLKSFLASGNHPEYLFSVAAWQFSRGNYQESAKRYMELGFRYPESGLAPAALYEGANIHLYELELPNKGFELLEKVYTRYPEYEYAPEAIFRTAAVKEKDLNYDQALDLYREIKDRYPASTQARRAVLRMAEINEEVLENPGKAIDLYREALNMSVTDDHISAGVRQKLALLYDQTPGMDKQARTLREAAAIFGDSGLKDTASDPLLPLLAEIESFYIKKVMGTDDPIKLDGFLKEGLGFFSDTARLDTLREIIVSKLNSSLDTPQAPVLLLWEGKVLTLQSSYNLAAESLKRVIEEYTADEYLSSAAAPSALYELAVMRWKHSEAAEEARALLNSLVETWPSSANIPAASAALVELEALDRLTVIAGKLSEEEESKNEEDKEEPSREVLTGEARLMERIELLTEGADICTNSLRMPGAAVDYLARLAVIAPSAEERASAAFHSASLQASRGAVGAALDGYNKFIKEFPADERVVTAQVERGRLMADTGRIEEAKNILTALLENGASSIAAKAGTLLLTVVETKGSVQNQVDVLGTLIESASATEASKTDYRLKLGKILFKELRRPLEAIRVLDRVEEKNTAGEAVVSVQEDTRLQFLSARIKAEAVGDLPAATENLTRILAQDPDDEVKQWAMDEIRSLGVLGKINSHENFIKKYPTSPRLPEVLWSLAHLYDEVRKDHLAASRIYREIIALFPDGTQAEKARKAMSQIPARMEIRRIELAMMEGDNNLYRQGYGSRMVPVEEKVFGKARLLIRLGLLLESINAFEKAADRYRQVDHLPLSSPGENRHWLADLAFLRCLIARAQFDPAGVLAELGQDQRPPSSPYLLAVLDDFNKDLEKDHYVREAWAFVGNYPDDIAGFDLLRYSADILVKNGAYEEALDRMTLLLKRYPGVSGSEEVSLDRCQLEEDLGRYDQALECYREHMIRYDFSPELSLRVADMAVERLDNPQAALSILNEALATGEETPHRQAMEAKISYLESFEIVAGLEKMARHHGGQPSAPGFLMSAARVKIRLSLPGEAVALFMKVADEYPTSPLAPQALWEAAAMLHKTFGDKPGSASLYHRLRSDYPSHRLAAQVEPILAVLEVKPVAEEARPEKAETIEKADIKALQEKLELDLETTVAGKAATMEKALEWTTLNSREKQWLHLQLADIYQHELKEFEKAGFHLKETLDLVTRESEKKTILLRLGGLYEDKLNNFTAASEQLQIYLDEFPADPEAARVCFHLGEIFELRLGEYERARLYYERVINSFIDSEWVDDALFRLSGNYEKYFRDYETALGIYEDLINRYVDSHWADDAQYRRGVIYERYLREYETAIIEYEKLSLNYSNSPWERSAQEAISRLEGKF